MQKGLAGIRILDFSGQIAGPYCSKLFVDGGADVIKVESEQGDSLRRWSATGAELGDEDSALFRFLNAGKQSLVGSTADAHVQALLAEADLVIEAHGLESDSAEALDVAGLRAAHPSLVVLSITPYGTRGPWVGRRASEFTLQAESGSIGMRGLMGHEPFQAGGRISEWGAGIFAAVAALPAVFHARETGRGEHIDLSIFETANLIYTNFSETMNRLMNGGAGDPEHAFLSPTVETPSIEPTADGYVGFCTNSRQQFSDFLLLIERSDLQEDEQLAQFAGASSSPPPTAASYNRDVPIESMTPIPDLRPPPRDSGPTAGRRPFPNAKPRARKRSWGGGRARPMHFRSRGCASSTPPPGGRGRPLRTCWPRWGPKSSTSNRSVDPMGCGCSGA